MECEKNIIDISNVSKQYAGFELKNINCKIPKAKIVGLIGENGSGKSTLIKIILGLTKADTGEVEIFNKRNNHEDMRCILAKIGVVLDENFIPEDLKVSNIAKIMGSAYKSWNNKLFFSYIQDFNIPQNKRIKEFSKGMKMKVAIIMSLAHEPSLLILDEPTSGLDPIVREDILDLLLNLNRERGMSILFSSHITTDIEKIADYIMFINNGKLELFDKVKTVLTLHKRMIIKNLDDIKSIDAISYKVIDEGYDVMLRKSDFVYEKNIKGQWDDLTIDEIMSFYIKGIRV